MYYTSPTEMFFTRLQWSFLGGLYGIMPIFWLQVWFFFAPGLRKHEQKNLALVGFCCSVLLYLSSFFTLNFLLPNALNFLASIMNTTEASLVDFNFMALSLPYLHFTQMLLFAIAIVYQIPFIVFILSYLYEVSLESWLSWRPYIWLICGLIGTLLSPPDVFSQVILWFFLSFIFEFYLWSYFLYSFYLRSSKELFPFYQLYFF